MLVNFEEIGPLGQVLIILNHCNDFWIYVLQLTLFFAIVLVRVSQQFLPKDNSSLLHNILWHTAFKHDHLACIKLTKFSQIVDIASLTNLLRIKSNDYDTYRAWIIDPMFLGMSTRRTGLPCLTSHL